MKISHELETLIHSGIRRIGEIVILPREDGFALHHHRDSADDPTLLVSHDPEQIRAIALFANDGSHRISKTQENLRQGWLFHFSSPESLLLALDFFYPAAVGMFLAHRRGDLKITHLRDKLNRQTGMYIGAKFLSDTGAQALVAATYGPGHRNAQRILWQIDPVTPLAESPARSYLGFPPGCSEANAIPLLSPEADNLFVADCRRLAKQERNAAKSVDPG